MPALPCVAVSEQLGAVSGWAGMACAAQAYRPHVRSSKRRDTCAATKGLAQAVAPHGGQFEHADVLALWDCFPMVGWSSSRCRSTIG